MATSKNEPALRNQALSALIIGSLGGISIGAVLGFSAIMLPQMSDFTLADKSWIASVANLGQLVGSFSAGLVSNYLGRKRTLLLYTIPLLAGWLLLIFNYKSLVWSNIARILQGFGMMPSACQVYLVEILDVRRRETLGALVSISISIGITLTYVLGAFMNWLTVAWIFFAIVLLQVIGLCYVPESPQWLMTKGRVIEAEASLAFLRGRDYDCSEEIKSISTALTKSSVTSSSLWREFLEPEAYKPLFIMISLWFFQQFSGNYAVIFYAVDIFKGITEDIMDDMMKPMDEMDMHDKPVDSTPYLAAILVGSIRIFGSIIGVVMISRKLSRRLLMVWSSIGMMLAMMMLVVVEHFKIEAKDEPPFYLTILLVVGSSLFILFHSFGFNIIPMLLVGELCPVRLKSITSGITVTVVALLVFTVVKVFPIAMASVGAPATYGFFSVICMGGSLFSYHYIPETRGKSVHELQDLYSNK